MMKTFVFISYILLISVEIFSVVSTIPPQPTQPLLGAKQCTWGPSYWCQNITNAAGCRAVKHCIQTVWEHKKLPPDSSSVCQTCLSMVKQARDQLLSNLTESEIQEVFDGSCDLIPIKIIAKECRNVVDQFVPELVDTLASQMDPQVVCSVAGLCNNERYTKLIAEFEQQPITKPEGEVDRCKGCLTVLQLVDKKFKRLSRDQVLQEMLKVCGKMGSLSDGCSNIVLTYFNEIYNHLLENLGSDEFCLMSGECSAKFHQHTDIEITPLSKVGNIDRHEKNDLPCDLCEQLVVHLRDIIVANTTENEFERVLLGICKQTKAFSQECESIVHEYYPVIYHFLSDELNGTILCGMIGICPGPGYLEENDDSPIVPLLPMKTIVKLHSNSNGAVALSRSDSAVRIINPVISPELAQLPIERLMPQTLTMIGNTKLCAFCEYFLHYVQKAITDPKTEDEIKTEVDKACDKLPSSVNATCREFVNTYGDAFVALLAQEIDPSVICPLLSVCKAEDTRDVEVFMKEKGDKPNCPLCLFAISKLEEVIKNNKTENEIRAELKSLCSHFSKQLKDECDAFVEAYADHIVDAIMADLTPQEVCVFLKLCNDKKTSDSILLQPRVEGQLAGDILTNEIPDQTADGKTLISAKVSSSVSSPLCAICEFMVVELEKVLKDNSTDAEILRDMGYICQIVPVYDARRNCEVFISKYGKIFIALLQDKVAPQVICSMITLCVSQKDLLRDEVQGCGVCQGIVMTMTQILENPRVVHDQEHVLEKTCRALPLLYQEKCREILQVYGTDLFTKVKNDPTHEEICDDVGLCHNRVERDVLVGANKCTWGPSYWCDTEDKAKECKALKHCQEKVWKAEKP